MLLERFAGRPTALYRADRLAAAVQWKRRGSPTSPATSRRGRRRSRRSASTSSARTSPTPGAHKVNNALGQALLTRRLGKTRVIAETGAGPARRRDRDGLRPAGPAVRRVHGRRGHRTSGSQRPADARARRGGAHRSRPGRRRSRTRSTRRCATGSRTSRRPTTSWARRWVRTRTRPSSATSSAGSATRRPPSCSDVEGRLPDLAIACVGGGSNAIGLLARFIGEPTVRLAVAEAAGDGLRHGPPRRGHPGRHARHPSRRRSLMLQDRDGQVVEAHSASAGLDYPGIGPQLAALAEGGRLEVAPRRIARPWPR